MLYRTVITTLAVLAVTSMSVRADSKEDLSAAVKKTAEASNYSWTSTVEGGFGAGTTTGQTEKDGYTHVSLPMRDQSVDVYMKGKKAVIKTDDGWKTADEILGEQGGGFSPERFAAMRAQNYQTPLQEAEDVVGKLEDVKAEADGFSGTLSEAAAKDMMTFRRGRRRGGQNADRPAPEVKNAKATIRVWTKDGVVTKAQYHTTGTITFNDQDRDIDRTTTVELKDVGSTKVNVPDEVKKKLETEAAPTAAPTQAPAPQ